MSEKTYAALVYYVRVLLGIEFIVNGLNWWVKLITPYPSISDGVDMLPPGDFVAAMIKTGFLFHIVKGVELGAGIALLFNRFVPLALVLAMPVTVNVFFVDVFMGHKLRSYLMGTGALLMHGFLMLAYLERYLPFMALRTWPDQLRGGRDAWRSAGFAMSPALVGVLMPVRVGIGVVAAFLGTAMIIWVAAMIVQHLSV